MKSRIVSAIIAGLYLGGAVLTGDLNQVGGIAFFLLLPLGLIWYSDYFGEFTGWIGRSYVSHPTHPNMIALVGWIILFLPMILLLLFGPEAIRQ